jgi:hypothetical protein
MSEPTLNCPDCDVTPAEAVDRRGFLRNVGGTAVTLAALEAVTRAAPAFAQAAAQPARAEKPAEALVRELWATLTNEQKTQVVRPWNHGAGPNQIATRLRMYNAPLGRRIADVYTPAQRELNERILRSIGNGDTGWRCLSRGGDFDASGSFQACGADIFGDPTGNQPFAWVFSGHHLTVRCDGNSEANTAFGGPMYYGHTPEGYSQRNVFNYQTRSVLSVYDALNEAQRRQAIVVGTPGELAPSIRFRARGEAHPGIRAGELTADQRRLVETVMRDVLSPFRREDGDEVMELIRRNGGLDQLHLAFYRDRGANDNQQWHFWRLEGPGFVWNYRVLPHVHTYVNIALQPAAPAAAPAAPVRNG